jgi:hypothetical protein
MTLLMPVIATAAKTGSLVTAVSTLCAAVNAGDVTVVKLMMEQPGAIGYEWELTDVVSNTH